MSRVRRRLIVYGGLGSSFTDDLWYLSLEGTPQWQRVATAGPTPGPRAGHSQVLDAERGVLWLFGGTRSVADLNDVWALDLATSTWRLVLPDGCSDPCLSRRSGAALAHDTRNDRLVRWGGLQAGGAPDAPACRRSHSAAWDLATDRLVVVFGRDAPA